MSSIRSRMRTLAAAAVLAGAVPVLATSPVAGAAEATVSGATLDWAVSPYVGTSSSLVPERAAGAPATVDADGWSFTEGTGTYDPETGVTELQFAGAIEVGNVTQGNYGIRLSDPSIEIDDAGNGRLVADVTKRGPGAQPIKTTFGAPVEDVTIVTFAGEADDQDGTVTWTVTPDTEDVPAAPAFTGAQQLPQAFLDVLGASLAGHFRQTDAAGADAPANIDKLPAPLSFSLSYDGGSETPTGPAIEVTPAVDLDPSGDTVTVGGSGFSGVGVYVRICAEPDGEPGTPEGRAGAADCDADRQQWVGNPMMGAPIAMGADGTFSAPLEVSATLTNDDATIDCLEVACGIAVRRDHMGGGDDLTYDSFTPITFQAEDTGGEDPGEDPGGEDPGGEDPGGEDPGDEPGTDPVDDVTGAIVGGELDWGIKDSFRSYIVSPIAHGQITTEAPATQAAGNGSFHFPLGADGTFESVESIDAGFAGGVHLYGHEGALDVTISDPQVVIDGDAGQLIADVVANEKDSDELHDVDDAVIADLDLSGVEPTADGDTVTLSGIPAVLTAEGEVAFSGFYHADDPLDPVTLVLDVEGADLGDLPGADPNADVVGCLPASAPAGADIEVCGSGFTPGEQVQVILHSTPTTIGVLTADAAGAVSGSVTIPTSTPAGTHHVELLGISSGRSITSAAITVSAASAGPGALPATGTDAGEMALVAGALLLAGAALTRSSRRLARA